MSIDVKGLEHKIEGTTSRTELKWGDIEEGAYLAELAIVYPWKELTRDTKVSARDEQNKIIKDDEGNYVKLDVKDLTWHTVDIVFKILDEPYVGYAVKGSLSTHPDMIGSANRFLYNAGLFGVSLGDLKDHRGTKVIVNVKSKLERYRDKNTGEEKEVKNTYVSYYSKVEDKAEDTGI